MEVLSSRVLIKCADPEPVRQFYAETLGLAVYREFPGGTVFFAGNGLLEVSGGPEATTSPEGAQEPKKNHELALWLQVRDIQDTVAELARVASRSCVNRGRNRGGCWRPGSPTRSARGSSSSRSRTTTRCGPTRAENPPVHRHARPARPKPCRPPRARTPFPEVRAVVPDSGMGALGGCAHADPSRTSSVPIRHRQRYHEETE